MILRQRKFLGLATPLVEKAVWRNFCQVIGSDLGQVTSGDSQKFSVLSFYHLKPLANPSDIRHDVEAFLKDHSAKGRVYIHRQGVNASMCVPKEHKKVVEKYFCDLLDVDSSTLKISE